MNDFKRDSAGIAELLNSPEFAKAVAAIAEDIGDAVRLSRPDADVVVDRYTTDRAAASVTIRDVRARAWVARDGALIREAASKGLEVSGR